MEKDQRARYVYRLKKGILTECVLVVLALAVVAGRQSGRAESETMGSSVLAIENDYIKWVDFTVSYEALCSAYEWDVKTHGTEHEICWVELLAYTAAKTGGQFDKNALKIMEKAAKALAEGEKTLEELTKDMKYYSYYREAYDAAIGGLVGEYQVVAEGASVTGETNGTAMGKEQSGDQGPENQRLEDNSSTEFETVYGLKGYFPLARGFDYTHYDDFGYSRS